MIPFLSVLAAIISIQFGASIAKELFPVIGILGTVTMRLVLASLMLSLVWKPWTIRLQRKDLWPMIAYGASLGLMNLTFYLALSRIPLGITVALEFLGPLSIAIFASRRPVDILWALMAAVGIVLILPMDTQQHQTLDVLGVVYALAAGAFWASYIIFGQKVGRSSQGGLAVCVGMCIATLFVAPIGLLVDGAKLMNLSALPYAFGVALLSSALPYTLEMIGLRKIPAKTFGILMALEPAMAALSGFLILNEHLNVSQCLAIACIMIASTGSSLLSRKEALEV